MKCTFNIFTFYFCHITGINTAVSEMPSVHIYEYLQLWGDLWMYNPVEVWRTHYSQLWQMAELFLGIVYRKYSIYYVLLGSVTRQHGGRLLVILSWLQNWVSSSGSHTEESRSDFSISSWANSSPRGLHDGGEELLAPPESNVGRGQLVGSKRSRGLD